MSEVLFDVVLGVVAVDNRTPANNKILLFTPKGDKPGLPTDFVGSGETSLDTASRILRDLTGLEARIGFSGFVEVSNIGLMDTANRYDEQTGLRRVSAIYVAAIPEAVELMRENVSWVNLEKAFNMPLYMDHSDISKLMMEKI